MKLKVHESLDEHSNFHNNFWKWFGNSVVIKNNQPLICYHGSKRVFDEFEIDPIKNSNHGNTEGVGVYFTLDKNLAKEYGSQLYECYLRIENPIYGIDYEFTEEEGTFLGYYKNPIIKYENTIYGYAITIKTNKYLSSYIDINTIDKDVDPKYYVFKKRKLTYKSIIGAFSHLYPKINIYDMIQNFLGYDGYIGSDWTKKVNDIYLVFNEKQIKSIKNNGAWDINDKNIYK